MQGASVPPGPLDHILVAPHAAHAEPGHRRWEVLARGQLRYPLSAQAAKRDSSSGQTEKRCDVRSVSKCWAINGRRLSAVGDWGLGVES